MSNICTQPVYVYVYCTFSCLFLFLLLFLLHLLLLLLLLLHLLFQVSQLFESNQNMRGDWASVSNTLSIRVRREQLLEDSLDYLSNVSHVTTIALIT